MSAIDNETETKTKTGVPEIKDKLITNQKSLIIIVVALLVVFLAYINIASGKNGVNKEDEVKNSALNFNENAEPLLVNHRALNSNLNLTDKGQTNNQSQTDIGTDTDEVSNVDPVKLMQFKKFMDEDSKEKMREIVERRRAATLIVNTAITQDAVLTTTTNKLENKSITLNDSIVKAQELVKAERTADLSSSILEGTIINATLETAVNSELPGSMRAVISRAVYSADGRNKLLNPGDRLIMQYTSKVMQGANRIFAMGTRIIKADGISIELGSAVASPLGISGVAADSVDRHFFARFAEAALLAMLSASSASFNVSEKEQLNSASLYREGLANSFSNAANESLQANSGRAPTLYVNQGKEITIFVAKDITFSEVYGDNL